MEDIQAFKKQHIIFAVEAVFVFITLLIVRFGLIRPLWDGEYLHDAMEQYRKGPIVQVKLVDYNDDCSSYSMGGGGFPDDGDYEFEIVGEGYY